MKRFLTVLVVLISVIGFVVVNASAAEKAPAPGVWGAIGQICVSYSDIFEWPSGGQFDESLASKRLGNRTHYKLTAKAESRSGVPRQRFV